MNIIATWAVYIFMFLFVAMIVVFNVARLVYFIKCFKIKDCCKKSCHFKNLCYKYYEYYSKEDIERLRKMVEESDLPNELPKKEDENESDKK